MKINKNVKEILDKYCTEANITIDKESDYLEILEECGIEVKNKKCGSHRWYDDVEIVTQFGDRFIKYYSFYTTGDNSPADMDLYVDLSEATEVVPYEETVVKVKYKEV